jgi:hypothetical protein
VPRFSSGAARPLSTLLGARRQRRFVSYLWVTVGAGLDGVERLVLRLTWVSDHSYEVRARDADVKPAIGNRSPIAARTVTLRYTLAPHP